MSMGKRAPVGYGFAVLYVLIAAAAVLRDHRPGGEVDPTSGFTPTAVRKHLKVIAREPRPSGSAANENARRYIAGELRRMGVQYESTPRFIARSGFLNIHIGARVRNVLARIPGKPGTDTVLVMAHFDSRPFAVGANDDGTAVAAMLETIRVIRSGPTPRNNLIFLFTDGEELGLLGARAFLRESPYADKVGLVLNFEGRGRTGPSLLFETSGPDAALVRTFARRAPNPVGTSLAAGVYRMMPNDTDFSPFRKKGVPGLNFAYMGDVTAYHSMLDNYASLDDKSLRHQSRIMLALTRAFAERDLKKLGTRGATFFNLDAWLVQYSNFTARVLAALAVIAWMLCIGFGLRGRFISMASLGRGFLLTGGAMTVAGLLVFALRWLVGLIHPDYAFMPNGDTYNVVWYRIAYTAAAIAVGVAMYGRFRGVGGMAGPFLGALAWWAMLTIAAGVFLPGAGYFFTWPLLICCSFLLLAAYQEEHHISTGVTLGLYVVLTCLWVYLAAGTLYIAMEGLTLGSIVLVMPVVVLVLVPLFPVLDIIRLSLRPGLTAAMVAVMACLLVGGLTSGFDAKHPRPDSVFFAYNQNKKAAAWFSCDPSPDKWTVHFLGAKPKTGHVDDVLPVLKLCPGPMRAPFRTAVKVPRPPRAPGVVLLRDRFNKGTRTVRLRISSARAGGGLHAFVDRRGVEIHNVRVNGIETKQKSSPLPKIGYAFLRRFINFEQWETFLMYAGSRRGYTLEFSMRAKDHTGVQAGKRPALRIVVVDQTMGLAAAGVPIPPRPEDIIPASGKPLYDSVFVSRRYEFR